MLKGAENGNSFLQPDCHHLSTRPEASLLPLNYHHSPSRSPPLIDACHFPTAFITVPEAARHSEQETQAAGSELQASLLRKGRA